MWEVEFVIWALGVCGRVYRRFRLCGPNMCVILRVCFSVDLSPAHLFSV